MSAGLGCVIDNRSAREEQDSGRRRLPPTRNGGVEGSPTTSCHRCSGAQSGWIRSSSGEGRTPAVRRGSVDSECPSPGRLRLRNPALCRATRRLSTDEYVSCKVLDNTHISAYCRLVRRKPAGITRRRASPNRSYGLRSEVIAVERRQNSRKLQRPGYALASQGPDQSQSSGVGGPRSSGFGQAQRVRRSACVDSGIARRPVHGDQRTVARADSPCLSAAGFELAGGPKWIDSERFEHRRQSRGRRDAGADTVDAETSAGRSFQAATPHRDCVTCRSMHF